MNAEKEFNVILRLFQFQKSNLMFYTQSTITVISVQLNSNTEESYNVALSPHCAVSDINNNSSPGYL